MTLPCAKYAPDVSKSDKTAYLKALGENLLNEPAKITATTDTCTIECNGKCTGDTTCIAQCAITCQTAATSALADLAACGVCLNSKPGDESAQMACAVDEGLTQDQIIGISVGVVLAVALIVGLVAGFAFTSNSSRTANMKGGRQVLSDNPNVSTTSTVATPQVLR